MRDLPSGARIEELDVPGKADADAAVGDALASSVSVSISSSVEVSLGAKEGLLVVKFSIHSLRPVSSACSWQQLDNMQCWSLFECPEEQSLLLLSQTQASVVLPSLIHSPYLN